MFLKPLTLLLVSLITNLAHGRPASISQDVQYAAALSRQIISDAGLGTILTIMGDGIIPEFGGHPFGIMEYYSGDCYANGNLLLYMSNLQMSARNMQQQPARVSFTVRALKEYDNPKMSNQTTPVQSPRLTLLGDVEQLPLYKFDDAMQCFGEKHPEAKAWRGFHDFHFYELRVKAIYYVGGFGGLNYIGWLPLDLYQQPEKNGAAAFQIQQ